jgi:hypothetical protein
MNLVSAYQNLYRSDFGVFINHWNVANITRTADYVFNFIGTLVISLS